jgi:hypothetical protein
MRQLLEQIIIRIPFYYRLKNVLIRRRQKKELLQWETNGKPVPPPHLIKQETLKKMAQQYRLRILVETGTYQGDMVEAMKKIFDHIYSIELSKPLYQKAKQRFKGQKKITLIQGDSGNELKNVVALIDKPALFWLDGHYSAGVTAKGEKDTPILKELCHLLNSQKKNHIILIDDAHFFGTNPAYPDLNEISQYVKSKNSDACINIQNNIIIITPKA